MLFFFFFFFLLFFSFSFRPSQPYLTCAQSCQLFQPVSPAALTICLSVCQATKLLLIIPHFPPALPHIQKPLLPRRREKKRADMDR
ncbi:hypothetical protein IWZ03DRAFT_102346 [Phyllosticta citriasiana]|uniref:Secreted protein n=1 Tax=Phyllosticta citriasiana TaxID=595635 RepID=A0ABR1KZ25_9PEZI